MSRANQSERVISMGADGHLNFDTRIDTGGFNKGIKALKGLGKVGATAIGACAVAFGAVTKASLDSVASLEQNVGGVETLFKKSADKVIANAERAYKTAGMSANEYMSTVTSFSASLLQSLGGDTEKAASVADIAITDMSDNANKMGTSIEMIQNAYQGFAKQNYTMLDNLKLGYGGTKSEMERLLADAEKISGVKYDISNLNDVYQAIHVVQEEMGITGTTAKEAASTIEGSMASAKAAWDNFLNGTITADEFAGAVTTAANNIIQNLGVIVPRLVETIPAAISGIASAMGEQSEMLLNIGMEIISALVQGVASALPRLVESAVAIISSLGDYISDNLPTVFDVGLQTLEEFVSGILQKLPQIIDAASKILSAFLEYVMQNLPLFLDSGVKLILKLVDGIVQSLPNIISSAISLVGKLLKTFLSNAPKLIQGGLELIGKLAAGIIKAVPDLIAKIPGIISDIKDEFLSIDWAKIGKDILLGIANGLKNGAGAIIGAAKEAARNALDSAKDFLDIHSPSRVFRDQVGKMMALGMGIGFKKNIPIKSMNAGLKNAVQQVKKDAILATTVKNGKTVGGIKKNPTFFPQNDRTDWDEWERRQRKLNKERDSRPVFLGTERIDRPLPKGAVPAL